MPEAAEYQHMIRTSAAPLACATWLALVPAHASQAPAAAQPPDRSPGTLRIAVDLVQVDATVTDERGRNVPDLTAADFQVLQNGRPQTISTFAYVRAGRGPDRPDPGSGAAGPSRPITADRVRRTIAIVVDDLGLSFESTVRVREALQTFVENELQDGDLVAILRTGAGMGALQQFTSDKRMLRAAVERIRWNMLARLSPFGDGRQEDEFDAVRRDHFTAGTLGAIRYVVRGVAALPGRKSVIVLSDGFRVMDYDGTPGRVLDALRGLVDAANRAGVVVYTVDARGLLVTGRSAAEAGGFADVEAVSGRGEEVRATQQGLGYLAAETGGLFVANNNDVGAGVRRAIDDQQGYYLIGYVPERSTFSAGKPRFHRITVRLTRPGLRVRSRRGFLGVPDSESKTVATAPDRMADAVTSPFAGGAIRLRLTSFFGYADKAGAFVQSIMHVDAHDLTFAEQPDGTRTTELETLAMTFGDNGQVADESSRRYVVKLTAEQYARALDAGFVYQLHVPLKRPGAYQLRIALRDVGGDRIGSASQFIDVPDVRKGRLTLSGLVLEGVAHRFPSPETDVDARDPRSTAAIRIFRQGTEAAYACYVYNARSERNRPLQTDAQVRLYREGVEVFVSDAQSVEAAKSPGAPLLATGILELGRAMKPGSYVLELTVVDRLAKKHGRATQMIDFEVVE
jgi:VWFA-related protein